MRQFAESRAAAVVALAVLSLIWGYNWVVVKISLSYIGTFQYLAIRMTLAAILLFAIGRLVKLPLALPHPKKTLLLGFLQTTLYGCLMTWALSRGGAGKVAVLTFSMPFWMIILAWLFLGERVRKLQWPIIFLAFVGIVCILEPWQLKSDAISNALAISGGIAWALSVLVVKKIQLESPRQLLALTAWQMLFGSVGLIVLAFVFQTQPIEWGFPLLITFSYSIILSTAAGWILWTFILQRLPANISGLSTLAIPVISVLTAWLQLKEAPPRIELAGIFLIAVALGGLALTAGTQKTEPLVEPS